MVLGILALIALLVIIWYFSSQKLLADAEERVVMAWAELDQAHQQQENLAREVLQRKADDQEITHQLRQRWQALMEVNINPADLNTSAMRRYQEGQTKLSQALEALQHGAENKSGETECWRHDFLDNYRQIQQQILLAAQRYNAEVKAYNRLKNQFPLSLLAFSEKPLYQIDAERVDR